MRVHVWISMTLVAGILGCGPAPRTPESMPPPEAPPPEEFLVEYRAAARAAWVKSIYLEAQGDLEDARGFRLEALRLHKQAVRMAPHDADMRLALARLELEEGRVVEVTRFLKMATERYAGSPQEHLLLARLLLLGGDRSGALASVDSALVGRPDLAPAWELRGRLQLQERRLDEALLSFEKADSLLPHQAETLAGLGEAHERLGSHDQAEAAYLSSLRLDPTNELVHRALGRLYVAQERYEEAQSLARAWLVQEREHPMAIEAYLETCIQTGDLEEAVRFARARHEEGLLPERAVYLYGRVLLQLGHLAAADSVLVPLAERPGARGVHRLLGDLAVQREKPDEAKEHYQRAIQQDPRDCAARTSLVLIRIQDSRDEAGQVRLEGVELRRVLKELGDASIMTTMESRRCHVMIGLAFLNLKQFDSALPHLEAGYELDPSNRDVLFNLGIVHHELGNLDRALQYAHTLLELEPGNAVALNFTGYILAEQGEDLDRSEDLIRKALEQDPENGYYVDSLGWVFYRRGEYVRAAAELERAVELTDERDPIILEHLGDAYLKLGRLDGAYRVYQQSRGLRPDNAEIGHKLADVEAELGKP